MNEDLERDLAGTGMLDFAAALRAAPQACVSTGFADGVIAAVRAERTRAPRRGFLRRLDLPSVLPAAAALALLLGLGAVFMGRPATPAFSMDRLVASQRADGTFSSSSAAPYVQAFAVTVLARDPSRHAAALGSAVDALVREQNAEGGWANAAVSARNVAALRQAVDAGVAGAARAYRRGLRYLRLNGQFEASAEDLAREAQAALARLGASADRGLACSVALCARR